MMNSPADMLVAQKWWQRVEFLLYKYTSSSQSPILKSNQNKLDDIHPEIQASFKPKVQWS